MLLLLGCAEDPAASPSSPATGPPIFPGPGADGYDADLAALALAYDRQFLAISAAPYGMSLDAFVSDRGPIDDWLASGTGFSRAEFEAQSGADLYDVVYDYDEMGDLGMFGGVAALGETWRYALLRQDAGAVEDDVVAARERLEQLLSMLHAMQAMTGRSGSLVRGLARLDQPGMDDEEIVVLFDQDGSPLPEEKSAVWRQDQSGEFPDFVWRDDTSKDQWIGYCLMLGAAWEVARDDPDIDPGLVAAIEEDAAAMLAALQVPSEETGLDLTLIDGDGRPTTWHDLNAAEFEGTVFDSPLNPFNAWMALAGVRVLSNVTGDDAFYQELAFDRGYPEIAEPVGSLIYLGYATNYSNVNMAWVSAFNLLHTETDETLRGSYLRTLDGLWGEGDSRAPATFGGAWYAVLYAALAAADDAVVTTALEDLRGWPDPPYWNDEVVNCDADEIAAGVCLAMDGVTEIELYGEMVDGVFQAGESRGAYPVAKTLVPRSVRPPSDFEWRSDPYRVNEGGGDRLDPGGDFRAAYWSGRYLARGR
jgi:hypothetical protein